ncbi:MAG: hypothetical protein B6D39_00530 [Anaerolineae bacterium UTCFX2]|mgnify:CR=1 FL=1|jgi:hypothetical protein|nr:phosphodiester glycosidase family protein [Anaerolineales bacterium]OQY94951.1 MAG: hypothetical protein B6D39_00530 [Anaerolineae bacterium UTCFX2]
MHRRFAMLMLCLLLLDATGAAQSAPSDWTPLAPGIDFQYFHLNSPRPIDLFVSRLNRSEPNVTLDTAIAQGKLVEGREKVSEMSARYSEAINYWGENWGGRNWVVTAVNGYYFNLASGRPLSGQIQSGWYVQRFSDYTGDTGFAWNLDRSAYIGKCVYHTPRDQFLTVRRTGATRKINGVNRARGPDELVLFTSHYNSSTLTDNSGVEVLVEMSRPNLVLPAPAMALGTIVQIRDQRGNTLIPFDHIVLSASGEARTLLLDRIQLGDEIGISQEISNCAASPQVNWDKTYAALGGDYHFLTGGVISIDPDNPDAFVPNSRTAVAFNSSYVYTIVADGWHAGVSEGISIRELGQFLKDRLGATDAVSLDSGGSSTMVVYGQAVNNTYCNFTRKCGMGAAGDTAVPPAIETRGAGEIRLPGLPPAAGAAAPDLEALVGNALMMVYVHPKVQNNLYAPDQPVQAGRLTELRLGPGSNYAAFASLPAGSSGTTLGMHYKDLNGVLAKGAYWQRVKFGNLSGWVQQDALYFVPPPDWPRTFLPFIRR